jgi:hypothetical protein
MDKAYTARGQTVDEILLAVERGLLQAKFGADADQYMQAALTAAAARAQERAADAQERWARRATFAAWASAAAAIAAVIVAALGA